MGATIKWHTGTPNCDGCYIVTTLLPDGNPFVSSMCRAGYHWYTSDGKRVQDPSLVAAWFKMSDIPPYRGKEKTK